MVIAVVATSGNSGTVESRCIGYTTDTNGISVIAGISSSIGTRSNIGKTCSDAFNISEMVMM